MDGDEGTNVKAAAYERNGPPEVLEYVDLPDPQPGPSDLLIRVEAVSIESGDTLNRLGGALVGHPHVVGYQCAGTIVDAGPKAAERGHQPGARVVATMAHGSHAELVAVPAAATWPIPEGADVVEAACVPIEFGTAHDCLFEFGHLQAGETVLVQAGAGGVGLAAIQLAKAAGARVLATASSDDRLERLRQYGLDVGINYATGDAVRAVLEHTDRRGVDLVVDPVGGRTLEASIAALAYRGRVSWVGRAGRDDKAPEVWPLMEKNASLTGVFLGAEMGRQAGRTHALIADLLDRCASGELQAVVDRTFP